MARGKAREKAKIIERQMQALAFRRDGLSYRKIAERLGISRQQAHNDVHDALRELARERGQEAEALLQLELERLDMLLEGLSRMAAIGNVQAALAFLRVCESRRKLLGLDAEKSAPAAGEVKIVVEHIHTPYSAPYTLQPPGRHHQSPGALQSGGNGAADWQNDARRAD